MDGNILDTGECEVMLSKGLGRHFVDDEKQQLFQDAKHIADMVIDYLDPEWLLRFGLEVLGVPDATDFVVKDWIGRRRPGLDRHQERPELLEDGDVGRPAPVDPAARGAPVAAGRGARDRAGHRD